MTKHFILTICVYYMNEEETVSFLEELFSLNGYENSAALVVVNGGSTVRLNKIKDRNDNIFIMCPGKNLGYFGGANWGLKKYLEVYPLPEWVIVCNTDISFKDKDFFLKLKEYYPGHTATPAVIAPDIILETKGLPSSYKHQNPHFMKRPTKTHLKFYKLFASSPYIYIIWEIISGLRYKLINKLNFQKGLSKSYGRTIKIYAPFGAFIIFNKNYFESGGTLDYECFLFGEEIFVAETAYKLNLNVIYDPRLKVIHREHSSFFFVGLKRKAIYAREAALYWERFLK